MVHGVAFFPGSVCSILDTLETQIRPPAPSPAGVEGYAPDPIWKSSAHQPPSWRPANLTASSLVENVRTAPLRAAPCRQRKEGFFAARCVQRADFRSIDELPGETWKWFVRRWPAIQPLLGCQDPGFYWLRLPASAVVRHRISVKSRSLRERQRRCRQAENQR